MAKKHRYPKWLKKLHIQRKVAAVEASLDGKEKPKIWFRKIDKEHAVS